MASTTSPITYSRETVLGFINRESTARETYQRYSSGLSAVPNLLKELTGYINSIMGGIHRKANEGKCEFKVKYIPSSGNSAGGSFGDTFSGVSNAFAEYEKIFGRS